VVRSVDHQDVRCFDGGVAMTTSEATPEPVTTIDGWTGKCCGLDYCKPCNGEPEFRHDKCNYTCTLRPVHS
jgi:hypothetical protein